MSENDHFSIILRWSEAQHVYLGQVQDLIGVEGTGTTYEEALAAVQEAMRWWHERSGEGSSSPVS
jgi:predicted RNase H-like HicB family nuclease